MNMNYRVPPPDWALLLRNHCFEIGKIAFSAVAGIIAAVADLVVTTIIR